ncbi:MAG: glutathione S-transferase family protein [Cyanobacteria bacterium J06639_1]
MLKFYYHPLSPIARRVWIALLEKDIPFEPVVVDLRGEQMKPEFLAINPFHRVPVITDGQTRVIESLAILDYLEARYPTPSLRPSEAEAIAKMRMVQMVVTNELTTKFPTIVLAQTESEYAAAAEQCRTAWQFLDRQLGDCEYFGGATIDLADIVAGTTVRLGVRLGLSVASQPNVDRWQQRLAARSAWQACAPSDNDLATWRRWVKLRIQRHQQRQRRQLGRAS